MNYIKLHGNCFIVKGSSKALIYDLFKNRTLELSLNIAELFNTEFNSHPYYAVLERYSSWSDSIEKFTQYLVEKDFAFFTDEPDNFPPINLTFKYKSRIYSSIIEIDNIFLKNIIPYLMIYCLWIVKYFILLLKKKLTIRKNS